MDELGGKAFWLNQCRGIWCGYWGFGGSLNTYKMPFPIGFYQLSGELMAVSRISVIWLDISTIGCE